MSEGYALSAIAFGNSSSVAVGSGGTILQSGNVSSAPSLAIASTSLTGGFQLKLTGEAGAVYRVEASTNLPAAEWVDLGSVTNNQTSMTFSDSAASNFVQRYYRVVSP